MTDHFQPHLSRRRVLVGGTAAVVAGLIDSIAEHALAKASMASAQAPAFYRFKIGSMEATVASDGPLPVGDPSTLFHGASKEQLSKLLTDHFLNPEKVVLEQNVVVLNVADRLVLFDTGLGSAMPLGPTAGRLLSNLKAAGIDSKDIDDIVLTHAHPDHCWCLMTPDGTRNFPNAQIRMTQADFDFWTDEAKLGNDAIKAFVDGTRKQLIPNRDRMIFIKDGDEVVPGVQAVATPGHTVGHTSYMVSSQGQTFAILGDVAHHHVLSLDNPRIEFGYDTDPKQGVSTRIRTFDMLSANRIPFLAYHLPWPGVGHVVKQGDGYRYVPMPMVL
jgi:glyoxylase-like metal-dependent hydrolase (beta-lactamase superfamily II)